MFSPLTKQLIDALRRLPGVGPKSAQRLAFHLLAEDGRSKGSGLAEALSLAIDQVTNCQQCQTYTEAPVCDICNNSKRNPKQLCIVEGPLDLLAIEQTNSYSGLYFVLHGRLSPLEGIGPDQLGIPIVLKLIQERGVEEVILATNPTVEGKATAHYLASQLPPGVSCTRIAQGVPLGGELEYLDGGTLSLAFNARRQLNFNEGGI
jgi:recombination protein RecR